ncbi:hypothetical protein Dsin_031888 [Dipteronia sinensis]|uniref:Prolamin-like domain-containing protein n=1 Tax=Dipteronia sinensis TaxID=43782 RepID=A0AAD9ZM97_9ROSI|nr:hypothetical protein Dsin_031888 [Dipteronia sinensis]
MIKVGVVAIMFLFLVQSSCSYIVEPPLPWPAHERLPPWYPHYDPQVQKCLSDIPGLEACHPIILHSYSSRIASKIKEKCCKAIRKLDEDCSSILFDRFNSPFFRLTLLEHCSNNAVAPAPAPKA